MTRGVFLAIDTGGTFTDLVSYDASNQVLRCTKSLTTPHDPIDGILDCIDKAGVRLDDAVLFKHGTTHVINTLLERSGPQIALVTTRGFRDVLELGRGNRTETFNLFFRRDPPLVRRDMCFEVDERIDGKGNVLRAPCREAVDRLAAELRHAKVAALAISFINSYLNPGHEQQVSEWLRALLPDCFITAGSELTREWYEFERTSTVSANAYVGPRTGRYVEALEQALNGRGFPGRVLMMGSNGGILSAAHSAKSPILLIESGPVGGCIGAGAYGDALGFSKIIAFDMGGTTAKCALVHDGHFEVDSTYYAGGYGKGIPIKAPVIDIVEVGAGGGSIAWVDEHGGLKVGPKSAGSSPGPVAYGRGGTAPTVTDANLVLNRINAEQFQGGEMRLDVEAARRAIAETLAGPLGYGGATGVRDIAAGILSIASATMSEAIKRITVQRGVDPRDYVLFAYGGGGPLHCADLARELGISLVVIPPEAGNFSAVGMLLADIRQDQSQTFVRALSSETAAETGALFRDMENAMGRAIRADFGEIPMEFSRALEMRHVGQYHTVRIPADDLHNESLLRRFHDSYRSRYGHCNEKAAVEIVTLHCSGAAKMPRPQIDRIVTYSEREGRMPSQRAIYFPALDRQEMAAVYDRRSLRRGFAAQGPALVEEYGTTSLVGPEDRFEIGPAGEIRIHIGGNRKSD